MQKRNNTVRENIKRLAIPREIQTPFKKVFQGNLGIKSRLHHLGKV